MIAQGNAKLAAIHYELGKIEPTSALLVDGVPMAAVDELVNRGVRGYSVFECSPADALRRCIARTLADAQLDATAVDVVVVATESFERLFSTNSDCSFRNARSRAFDLFYDAGLSRAAVTCVTFGGCTNVLQALVTAKALVEGGTASQALVVAGEVFAGGIARMMSDAVSVAGDGVASCIVSNQTKHGSAFSIDTVKVEPYRGFQRTGEVAKLLLGMFRAITTAASRCYAAAGTGPGEYQWVIVGDYNRTTSETFARLLGFQPEKVRLERVGTVGHIPFDTLIHLADLACPGQMRPGDSVLSLACGPVACGVAALRHVVSAATRPFEGAV